MADTDKKVILTCTKPTGTLHLGNYLGAIRNWAAMIDEFECFFGIVDLHAITLPYVPADLRKTTYSNLALYIACGLDPKKCHIFCQNHVVGHTELAWILGCLCPIGQLERMTQYKDKSRKKDGGFIGAGLLNYPILMAADILIYNADRVPVGEDQKQHVELCRDLAIKFNNTYSETFRVPDVYIPKTGARIKSLQDPDQKMSKSDENQSGCIDLLDPPELIRKKIRSAVTDSGSEILSAEDKPGITNLLNIMSSTTGTPISELEDSFKGSQYGAFKDAVADSVISCLEPIQKAYTEIHQDKAYLDGVFKAGAEVAQKRAYKMLSKVYRKAGFAPRT